ncbi:YbfB/YjiJ family MFS transporter [Pelovirga terrestris]|uniref:YbfB/YjiJ family MFS transporter n=1 Tax=Pelovirga terrestris TaxID=2771352 RepID=A0A8J6QYU6_9BACT|nr:YbfB/YjiJ family MFS transporter [Pelovirga terrestris]MBD1401538.1 YbfB/YjiJ family MFS transporter [Pelovirga terrestris]
MPDQKVHTPSAQLVLVGGILGLMVAMGIGRFAYTPILPLMQRDLGMSNTLAGWLAGLNYLGYLMGAILCSLTPRLLGIRLFTGSSLLLCILTTALMGLTVSAFWWGGLRLVSGITSAVLFVLISAEVGDVLRRQGLAHHIGTLYSGVGLGIALTGVLIPVLDHYWSWSGAWIGAGIAAALLATAGILLGHRQGVLVPPPAGSSPINNQRSSIYALATAYFFEGLGYVVSATFIVALITSTPGLSRLAPWSWVAVGLAAVPSTLIWPWLARRYGARSALIAAYALQAAGIMVSVFSTSVIGLLFAAASFGGTFMGIVALTLAEGQRRMPADSRWIAAFLTAAFGIGQVLGPIVAGRLADLRDDFALPLLLATACVGVSLIVTVLDSHFCGTPTHRQKGK